MNEFFNDLAKVWNNLSKETKVIISKLIIGDK